MEVTSATHVSSNGKTNLGHLRLTIGLDGALHSDGDTGEKIDRFLALAQATIDRLRQSRQAGTFDGVMPVVGTDGDMRIELDMALSSRRAVTATTSTP